MKTFSSLKITLLFVFLQLSYYAISQSERGLPSTGNSLDMQTDTWLQELRKDSRYKEREERMNREILSFSQRSLSGDTLVLPVVFHIIRPDPSLVSDQVIMDALNDLNDAFGKSGKYAASTGVDTKIRFCLAQTDPEGGISTGITRTTSFFSGDLNPSLEDEKLKNLNKWDPEKYINIWYVETIKEEQTARYFCGTWFRAGIGGYASMPPAAGELDGIVVTRFEDMLAHEMGHYLSLYHTFEGGCGNNDCTKDGDRVCDTPPDATTDGAPGCNSTVNSCSSDTLSGFATDVPDLITNFMDYGNSSCANQFTEGQADRMRAAIQTQRTGLLELQCAKPCSENITAGFLRDNAHPLPGNTINFSGSSTGVSNYQWLVNDVVVSTGQNLSYSFAAAGKYKVTLKAYNSISCYASYTDYVIVTCGVTARFYSDKKTIASKMGVLTDSILFTNASVNATTYQWLVRNDKGMPEQVVSTKKDLNYLFTEPAVYSARLIASNGSCSDTTKAYTITVLDPTPDGYIDVSGVECYNTTDITLKLYVCNYGFAPLPTGIPITFYDADPRTGKANELKPKFIFPGTMPGSCCGPTYTHIVHANRPGLNQIFAVFNDSGNTSPLQLPNTSFAEKDYLNNIRSFTNFQFTVSSVPPSATLEPGDTLHFTAQASPGIVRSYNWSSPRDLSCTDCKKTILTVDSSITKRLIAISENGCTDTAFVDIKVPPADDHTIKINGADCAGKDSIHINFTISNSFKRGIIRKGMSVAFYSGDPNAGNATLLQPVFVVPDNINAKEATFETFIKGIDEGNLFAVVNDNGTTVPIKLPNQAIYLEKDYSNNLASISYKPEKVVLQPNDTTVFRKQGVPLKIVSTLYNPASTTWLPGNDYTLSCSNCPNPVATVYNSVKVQMQTANKYGCFIKGEAKINIFPPDMTARILKTNCYTNNLTLVTFEVCMNNGYDSVFAGIPVAFYDSISASGSLQLLKPVFYTPSAKAGTCNTYTHLVSSPSAKRLLAVVNDKGENRAPIPDKKYDETNYTNNFGRIDFAPFSVSIVPNDTSVPRYTEVILTPNATGGSVTSYAWKPAQFLSCNTCSTAVAKPPYSVQYQLLAKNEYSCTDTATAMVRTFSGGTVNIPTAFTPNADGLNDVFYLLASPDVEIVKDFSVFNRWGEKVFQVNSVPPNDPNFGWNGYFKSVHAPAGAYVYQATIRFTDGKEQFFKGTVVLIR